MSCAAPANEDGLEDGYPLDATVVMLRTVVKEDRTAKDVADLILNAVLGLNLQIKQAEVIKTFNNGKSNIKVELTSQEDVTKVMQNKVMLGTVQNRDIRSVWIRRSKTRRQRIQDHNNAMMLKALNLHGKYRQDGFGRLVPVNFSKKAGLTGEVDTRSSGQAPASKPPPAGSKDETVTSGDNPRGRGRGGGRGRGRGKYKSHRGRGVASSSTSRERSFTVGRSPLKIRDDVISALSLPVRLETPAQEIENWDSMETGEQE